MKADHRLLTDPRIVAAIDELRGLISARFPSADFRVGLGEDPEGVYLRAVVDVEDRGEVVDVFLDRLVDFQLDGGLPLYVVVGRTQERNAEIMRLRSRDARVAEAVAP